jgi:hypothetical protein
MIAGVAVATSPLFVAGVVGLLGGTSMWDESSGSGAILWLLMLSIPIGLSLVVASWVVLLTQRSRRHR